MENLYQFFVGPFAEFSFMRYALVSCVFLAISSAPIGVFLSMRRMSLMGDAMSHAILPGAAVGYMIAGLSLPAMSLGGFIAGVLMAIFAGLATRLTSVKEDANFAAFYLTCLALGVLLISSSGSNIDLLNLLFGSVLAVDDAALILVAVVASISILTLAIIYRPLVLESIDPTFLKAVNAKGGMWHVIFLMLVVINLVAGFQALGTLMSVGLMMLPGITAKLWARCLEKMLLIAIVIALVCTYGGLVISYQYEYPSGPAIILLCGIFYLFSIITAPYGSILSRYLKRRHLAH